MVANDMVRGLELTTNEINQAKSVCDACMQAKHARAPFARAEDKTTRPLELVHMDLCGPLPEPTIGKNEYFLTFLDDYSRFSAVRLVRKKSDVPDVVMETFAMFETQTGNKVKAARTDNGGEFIAKELADFFKSKGIEHQTTMAYSPQSNGKAERLNRTLMERTRAMLFDAKLPDYVWGEAITTANYLRNRAPTADKDKTPYEAFYGNKPDISHLRTFGCGVYAHVPAVKRNKLDPRSDKGVMVGYTPQTNGYRILLEDGQIIQSRDVVFDEKITKTEGIKLKQRQDDYDSLPNSEDEALEFSTDTDDGDEDYVGATNADSGSGNTASDTPDSPSAPGGSSHTHGAPASTGVRTSARANKGIAAGEWWKATAATAITDVDLSEPLTFQQALESEYAEFWKDALDDEYRSLKENNTWTPETPPAGVKPIPVKWVFKVKKDATGRFDRFKARLVVKGFRQKEGVDFNEVFAPVSKYSTMRAFMAKVAAEDLEMHQVDIKTAFLNGDLEEVIYIEQPEGYTEGPPGTALRLNKTLYGLKQAPRAWYNRLFKELQIYGFTASESDPSLFKLAMKTCNIYLLIYVDDILIAGKDIAMVNNIKSKLLKSFEGRDLGEVTSFLGINITRNRKSNELKLDQTGMINAIVEKFGMTDAKTKSTPMTTGVKLTKTEGEALDTTVYPYGTLVGKLMFLAVATRPDLAYSVGALTRFMANPTTVHWQTAKGVVRYLLNTSSRGILFRGSDTTLKSYCDADYAGDPDTRRSTTGYLFMMNGGAISWNSKRQPTVAASTTEAEYMAAGAAIKEGLWIRKLFDTLDIKLDTVNIYCDNQSAIKLLKNPIFSVRSKHIDIIHHFARERVLRKEVAFHYLPTKRMLADIMTKALAAEQHEDICNQMGVV
jgi:hypothetical protein